MKQLLSMAKSFGKHLWDQNKSKIIDKGFTFGKELLSRNNNKFGKIARIGLDKLEDHLKKNNY